MVFFSFFVILLEFIVDRIKLVTFGQVDDELGLQHDFGISIFDVFLVVGWLVDGCGSILGVLSLVVRELGILLVPGLVGFRFQTAHGYVSVFQQALGYQGNGEVRFIINSVEFDGVELVFQQVLGLDNQGLEANGVAHNYHIVSLRSWRPLMIGKRNFFLNHLDIFINLFLNFLGILVEWGFEQLFFFGC